jgi:hypothetical protein
MLPGLNPLSFWEDLLVDTFLAICSKKLEDGSYLLI